MINSYPSIYNMGHAAVADILKAPVIVEEKVDGSQLSFSKYNGEVSMRSKGATINMLAPANMFNKAVEFINSVAHLIPEGMTFRGEYLAKPKHNVLAYDRVPTNNIIIFDVNIGLEKYATTEEKTELAKQLGLEVVPQIFSGMIQDLQQFRKFLDRESILGGQKIEGVVIKPMNYNLFGLDKKCLMAKFVSEDFKETHAKEWQKVSEDKSIMTVLSAIYTSPARWQKALLHLREAGLITDSPKDIGMLMKEVPEDVEKECKEEIKDQLYKWAWPQLRRMVGRGLPEWYKEQLLKKQFEEPTEVLTTPIDKV